MLCHISVKPFPKTRQATHTVCLAFQLPYFFRSPYFRLSDRIMYQLVFDTAVRSIRNWNAGAAKTSGSPAPTSARRHQIAEMVRSRDVQTAPRASRLRQL